MTDESSWKRQVDAVIKFVSTPKVSAR